MMGIGGFRCHWCCSKDQSSMRCSQTIETRNGSRVLFDTQGIDSCDGKTQLLLGDSVPKCALGCNEKYVKPELPRHLLKFELSATWRLKYSAYMRIGI